MQLFVDHLTVIDCSYLHPEHGIEGESWIVDVALEGELDEMSMVMDFGKVKKQLKAAIDQLADHALLVPQKSKHLLQLEEGEGSIKLQWKDSHDRLWEHESPHEALCLIDAPAITLEVLRSYLTQQLMAQLPATVKALHLQLHHEPLEQGMYYHYSHGLKKHDGNCQRIAHGHRSKLEIWKDGVLDLQEIRHICQKWAHIYLLSQEDITEQTDRHIISSYQSPQGRFWLKAPRECCDILPQDSTVERIAQHLAQQLEQAHPQAVWRVKAYEGVHKGAIISLRSSG